jgi:predicted lipid-binding transport protein (Tim44 family)
MSPADLLLLMRALPAVKAVVVAIVKAFAKKDEKAVREATEATLLLAFELRQSLWSKKA